MLINSPSLCIFSNNLDKIYTICSVLVIWYALNGVVPLPSRFVTVLVGTCFTLYILFIIKCAI